MQQPSENSLILYHHQIKNVPAYLCAYNLFKSLRGSNLNIIEVIMRYKEGTQSEKLFHELMPQPGYNLTKATPFLNSLFKNAFTLIDPEKQEGVKFEEQSCIENKILTQDSLIRQREKSHFDKIDAIIKKIIEIYNARDDPEKMKEIVSNLSSNDNQETPLEERAGVEGQILLLKEEAKSNVPVCIDKTYNKTVYLHLSERQNSEILINDHIVKLKRKMVEPSSFSFGYVDAHLSSGMQTYMEYFDFAKVLEPIKLLNPDILCEDVPLKMFSGIEDVSKKKLITFIIHLFDNFELKIEFSLKFVEKVFIERETNTFYFNMAVPPRFFLYELDSKVYKIPEVRAGWTRVPNFLFSELIKDELTRVFLQNNTVIKVSFKEAQISLEKWLNRFGILKDCKQVISSDKFGPISLKLSGFDKKTFCVTDCNLDFEIKYMLIVLLSSSRINVNELEFLVENKLQTADLDVFVATCKGLYYKLKRTFFGIEFNREEKELEALYDKLYIGLDRSKTIWISKTYDNLTFIRRIIVTPSGMMYGIEEPEMSNRVIRNFKQHTAKFLRITLYDDLHQPVKKMRYVINKQLKPYLLGFNLLGRFYKFLAFSSNQIRNASAWFLYEEGGFTQQFLYDSLGDFSSIKNPAKYASRIGLAFSSSKPVKLDHTTVEILVVDDIRSGYDSKIVFSDGIGKISKDLNKKIAARLGVHNLGAVQIRFGSAKGVLACDPEMKPVNGKENVIILRESMIKYKSKFTHLDIEVLDYNKYRAGYLNRQIILLLLTLGIKPDIFINLQRDYIESVEKIALTDASIYKHLAYDYDGALSDFPSVAQILRTILNSEANVESEPFIRGIVKTFRHRSFLQLKSKSNIHIEKSVRLIGVLDEYGILGENEVFVQYSMTGTKKIVVEAQKAIVTRNPCLHPGDIQIAKIVDSPELRKRLGHFVNCIVFPQKGYRPLTNMVSGGDLDGDIYFVCWDERLIPTQVASPMDYKPKIGATIKVEKVTVENQIDFFLEFIDNENLGRIANSHLALADQSKELANDEKCLLLAENHSDAVDFVKTGLAPILNPKLLTKMWPDYMGKKEKVLRYKSPTALGIIYRDVLKAIESGSLFNKNENYCQYDIDIKLLEEGWEDDIDKALEIVKFFTERLDNIMMLFGIRNEFEAYSGNFSKFENKKAKGKINKEMLQRKILDQMILLKEDCDERIFAKDDRNKTKFSKARRKLVSAIYIVSYYQSIYHKSKLTSKNISLDLLDRIESFKNENEIKYIGLPWFICRAVLLDILRSRNSDIEDINPLGELSRGNDVNGEDKEDEYI